MGLFDLFKNKQANSNRDNDVQTVKIETPIQQNANSEMPKISANENENKLEEALRLAANEAAHRPEFYRLLLSEDLVVLTEGIQQQGERILTEDTGIKLLTYPSGEIPVFTSEARILDKGVIENPVPFLAMNGEVLLNTTRGATLILNPYSDFGKQLLPDEIESVLNGTILSENNRQITAEKDTQVMLGQPQVYPTDMVNSLKIVLAKQPDVSKAYLGLMSNGDDLPHMIFAIDADTEDFQSIVNEAGFTAQQFLKDGETVNFVKIGGHSMDDYFTQQTEPFYVRNQ